MQFPYETILPRFPQPCDGISVMNQSLQEQTSPETKTHVTAGRTLMLGLLELGNTARERLLAQYQLIS